METLSNYVDCVIASVQAAADSRIVNHVEAMWAIQSQDFKVFVTTLSLVLSQIELRKKHSVGPITISYLVTKFTQLASIYLLWDSVADFKDVEQLSQVSTSGNAKCQTPNAKMPNAKMPNAKCQMPNAKSQMPNANCQNAKCQKPTAKCQMPKAKCQNAKMPKCQMPNANTKASCQCQNPNSNPP